MPTDLNDPILEGGLRRIPFFNGRVLTAEDLQTEQAANATERRRLGRALGTGVLEGLFVERGAGEPPRTVSVGAGRALAPSGRVVDLPVDVELSIVSQVERPGTAGTSGRFADCSSQEVVVTSGTGAYLLVVEPAAEERGRTPRVRLGDGAAAECAAQFRVEGARLRLLPLELFRFSSSPLREELRARAQAVSEARQQGEPPSETDVSMLRSLLAHACLGTATTAGGGASLTDAFRGRGTPALQYGPLDRLRQDDALSDDAVPLGLLYWVRDRIQFVDVWSVRRRVHHRAAQGPPPATDRRRAEAEAAVFQFHDHLDALDPPRSAFGGLTAKQYFAYLPPVGVVEADTAPPIYRRLNLTVMRAPFFGEIEPSRSGEPTLPPLPAFFEGVTVRGPSFLERPRLRPLVDEALRYPALALKPSLPPDPGPPDEGGPLVWLYQLAPDAREEAPEPPFVFATGYMPFMGEAQFDLARVNRATYGSAAGPPSGS